MTQWKDYLCTKYTWSVPLGQRLSSMFDTFRQGSTLGYLVYPLSSMLSSSSSSLWPRGRVGWKRLQGHTGDDNRGEVIPAGCHFMGEMGYVKPVETTFDGASNSVSSSEIALMGTKLCPVNSSPLGTGVCNSQKGDLGFPNDQLWIMDNDKCVDVVPYTSTGQLVNVYQVQKGVCFMPLGRLFLVV